MLFRAAGCHAAAVLYSRVVGLLVGHVKKEITNGSCNQAMNDPICGVECTKAQIVMNLQYNTPDLLTMNN